MVTRRILPLLLDRQYKLLDLRISQRLHFTYSGHIPPVKEPPKITLNLSQSPQPTELDLSQTKGIFYTGSSNYSFGHCNVLSLSYIMYIYS